jgi:hypothetical protein
LVLDQFSAAVAVPILIWQRQSVLDVATVTTLMRCTLTQIANDNLVEFFIIVAKTDVADNVIVLHILVNADQSVGIIRVNL